MAYTPTSPEGDLAAIIRRMQQQIDDLQNAPWRIPVLNADPGTTELANIWLLADGRLRIRHRNSTDTAWVIREWVPTAAGSATSGSTTAPPTAAPQTHSASWAATWSASYRGAGPQRTDDTTKLFHGYSGSSFNGRNRAYIGFPYATIQAALAGSTIKSVSLKMQQLHTYFSTGKIGFGYHNQTAAPASWAGTVRSMVTTLSVGKTELKTFGLPIEFATAIRDGVSRGISLEAPSDSFEYYGYAAGVGSGVTIPTLYVTYVK